MGMGVSSLLNGIWAQALRESISDGVLSADTRYHSVIGTMPIPEHTLSYRCHYNFQVSVAEALKLNVPLSAHLGDSLGPKQPVDVPLEVIKATQVGR